MKYFDCVDNVYRTFHEFEDLPKPELNQKLRHFFASVRLEDGVEMKKSTLVNLKYGIAKYLKENCGVDINTDSEFNSCINTFKSKLSNLKKIGKGSTGHKEEITTEDLKS